VCSLPAPGPKTVFLWVHSKENRKKRRRQAKHYNARRAVKILVLNQQIYPKHRLFPDTGRRNALSNYSCLAFPVQNYISSILITSFTLDIKLQKRWFPAQDRCNISFSYLEILQTAAAEATTATYVRTNGTHYQPIRLFNLNQKKFFVTSKQTRVFNLSITVLYSTPLTTDRLCITPASSLVKAGFHHNARIACNASVRGENPVTSDED